MQIYDFVKQMQCKWHFFLLSFRKKLISYFLENNNNFSCISISMTKRRIFLTRVFGQNRGGGKGRNLLCWWSLLSWFVSLDFLLFLFYVFVTKTLHFHHKQLHPQICLLQISTSKTKKYVFVFGSEKNIVIDINARWQIDRSYKMSFSKLSKMICCCCGW